MSIRLYVGNLPRELNRDELETLLHTEVGDVGSAKLITDRKTGKCRGFGFVTVETEEQADQVIEKLNGHVFKENTLKIEKANDKPKTDGKDERDDKETAAASPARSSRRNTKGKNTNRRTAGNSPSDSAPISSEAAQPDPRWADALAQLKERLMAQAGNP
ncbi:RNA-binding protein [Candidatus Synechococcus calcipolaris G9]|uniref:RNA-binding protein n=1 Tax=Candidatus Synechococcus calcipolaris G9 TaxID=1497997 RepID=A0ABT6EY91_9SYNE|nr:RNA-binding protein [Candidatus Synechococcus calcipolaris]MDG2990469.1 RNA-binding protein [Candidatus Synechococcus calcipolaris G9]